MGLSLNELLAADPSALRHSDWVELQRLARDEIAIDRDNLEKLKPLAARMREIDALRAEVAALRGLANIHPSRGDVPAVKAALDAMRGKWGSSEGAVAAIAAALATVPPAKVADAVKPEPECTCAASGRFNLAEINACLRHGARAPKPEAAGLEPLDGTATLWDVILRVNELSAIAKRGGL